MEANLFAALSFAKRRSPSPVIGLPQALAASVVFLACSAPVAFAQAQLPALSEPVKLMAGGKPIAVDVGHASPFVCDFNLDGKKDLLVGQFGGGKLRIYPNQGTDSQPQFSRYSLLQAEGVDATVPPS